MNLVMFIACYTADGGEGAANLPTAAVEQGAETAVGFTGTVDCAAANDWTEAFFALMDEGVTVDEACKELARNEQFENTRLS